MTDVTSVLEADMPDGRCSAPAWLVARHPHLRRLLERVPGFLGCGGEPDVDLLADTVCEYEQHLDAWTVYKDRHPAPRDDSAFEVWREAGPTSSDLVDAIAVMSPSERARLRMLATFSSRRVPVSVADFASLDAAGRAILTDWTLAVRSAG